MRMKQKNAKSRYVKRNKDKRGGAGIKTCVPSAVRRQPVRKASQLHPPQQQSSRMISRQLLLPKPLKPLPPHPQSEPFPQQAESSRRIQIILQQLLPEFRKFAPFPHPPSQPLSHPHPQFVAAKSLMFNPPGNFIYTLGYEPGACLVNSWGQKVRRERKDLYSSSVPYPHSWLGYNRSGILTAPRIR